MYFEQFYLGCLAHASYLFGSEGEAVVVDPQRDVEIYLEAAQKQNLQIRHIFETHLHADFVSGHKELAARTGATIYIGKAAEATFPHVAVTDGFELQVGKDTGPNSGNSRPHSRKLLPGNHRPRAFAAALGSAHRRHSFHRRCRPARSVEDAYSATTRGPDVRLASPKTDGAPERGVGVSRAWGWFTLRTQHARRTFFHHRH